MSGKVGDLLNFTLDESPVANSGPKRETKKSSVGDNFLMLDEGRKSLDNNPFDRFSKQVEAFSADPFEFVSAQSKNYKPVLSCIRTGNLLGLGDDSFGDKENNNNGGNVSPNKGIEVRRVILIQNKICSSFLYQQTSRSTSTGSDKKRDSLLKRSITNASKAAMTNDVVAENQMREKWLNMDMPDDSFNDLMKQELVLVDSDASLNDFEAEFNIPMLKEMGESKKEEEVSPMASKEPETATTTETSIIDRAIAKLNEIKMARESNMEDTMNKLKEMVSKVDTKGNREATKLVEQLCVALSKSSKSKNTLEPPPTIVRQGTFDIDKPEDSSIDTSNNSESNSPQLQSVIEKLSDVLGNFNMNVIQSSPDLNQNAVVVVVVNPEVGYDMSDTVTLAQHYNYNTPQPNKQRARRSQSFSSACRPNTVVPNPTRKESFAVTTPQRPVQPTRRSFSFSSTAPRNPIVQKRTSILPNVITQKPPQPTPISALSEKPANRLSFMNKLKPKIGTTKTFPPKATGPLKVVHREKSPNSTVRSISSTIPRQTPVAQSIPMSRIATPQKPSRVSFLTPQKPSRVSLLTPSRRPSTAVTSTLTVPKPLNTGPNIKRRSSFTEKPNTNLKPKPAVISRPSTGGLLTQRKFPPGSSGPSGGRPSSVTQKSLTLKLRK